MGWPVTLTPETIADLRQKAEAARDETDTRQPRDWDALSPRACKVAILHESLHPEYVIALLDRIATLEATYVLPSKWRCDGCGAHAAPVDGRRPDAHPSCGGRWVRE